MLCCLSRRDAVRGSACRGVRSPGSLVPGSLLACLAASGVVRAQSPPLTTLPAVVVTATRFPEDAATLPFGVSVVTAAQIQASGATTVNEAIMKLLGVPGRQDLYGGGDYALDLRGFGATADSNQVVILDGLRLNEADIGGTRLAGIPIDSVARIEVIRGSGTVLYGEGATGGVIVITTKAAQGVKRHNQAEVYAGVGSFGVREARAAATLATGGFALDATASHRDADNDRDNFRSKTDGSSATVQWGNEWLRAGVRYARDSLDTGLPGPLTAAQYAENPHQSDPMYANDNASIRNTRSSLFSQATLGDWQIGFDAARRDKALTSLNSGFAYDYDVGVTNYSLRARHTATLGKASNAFTAGWDSGAWQRKVLGQFGTLASQDAKGFYLHDEYAFASGTRVSAGWRREHIEVDGGSPASSLDRTLNGWQLGIVQPLTPAFTVFGNAGRSFRVANVDEIGFTSPGVTLQPQTSRDLELGARWTYASGRAELRVYRNSLTDEIGYDPSAIGPFGPGANVNFDPTRRQGVELELTQALSKAVDLRFNAASRSARFESGAHAGQQVPLAPRQTLALHADWRPAAGHRLDGGLNYVGSQTPDFGNACRMPSYTTADLRYAYRWRAAEFALGITNLADRKYYTQAFACVGGTVSSIYPEPGRAVTASVRLSF